MKCLRQTIPFVIVLKRTLLEVCISVGIGGGINVII